MYNPPQSSKRKSQLDVNKTIALGYKRVSKESQIDGASLDTQDKEIKRYCLENKLNLLKIFADEGKSGMTTVGRDGFTDLLDEVQSGNFVIVYELSRFCRDQADVINYSRDLVRNKGCTFICLNPRIDSRESTADLMIGIYSTVFQEESKRIGERVSANMQRLSEEGKLLCRPPFGYVHNTLTRQYEPDYEQQAVVEKIRLMNLGRVNQAEMARRLNAEGLGYVLNNNKTAKIVNSTFSRTTVNIILQNYGFIKDKNSPKFTYPQRVETWNQLMEGKKKKTQTHSDVLEIISTPNFQLEVISK